ncbi:glycosyltransferase family 8 [Lecanosticta acicola]|uniref:Glycosyltransferase family 8 n=1 Tax=Lecanosticta acicola TaxID=111012 RepID=A0AAI8Z0E6_9PEZI|nr:glycosyltransferase family 8 [Lecanosticta acicola]
MAIRGPRPPWNYLLAACVAIILLFVLVRNHDTVGKQFRQHQDWSLIPPLQKTTAKNAYATFLANWPEEHLDDEMNDDAYFVAARLLAYQLLHAPETRSVGGYPLVVLVNAHVSAEKRERLAKDGAVVWEPEPVDGKWIHNAHVGTWEYVMTKLRIWELTQFDKICFLDADTILFQPLDGVFDDPAAQFQTPTVGNDTLLPPSYIMAGTPELKSPHHHWPPLPNETHAHYMNAGFFVTQPSLQLLQHYLSFTATPHVFSPDMPEQNLLNHVHGQEGRMPWKALDARWNTHSASVADWRGGVVSMHTHYWDGMMTMTEDGDGEDGDGGGWEMKRVFWSWRGRMEGFWEGMEGTGGWR